MRIEEYGVDSILHIVKRGPRGMDITRDKSDRDRFVRLLFYLNDEYRGRGSQGWEEEIRTLRQFERPKRWPTREPLVRILGWTLMPNHLHLIVQEIRAGGTSKFMQRLGGSMSKHYNAKYHEQGSIFQGAYRARTIDSDDYLRYCAPYVMVKNPFELARGGLRRAASHFEEAWKWALTYPYSSFPVYASDLPSPIIDTKVNLLKEIFPTPRDFKSAARDMLLAHAERRTHNVEPLFLEDW